MKRINSHTTAHDSVCRNFLLSPESTSCPVSVVDVGEYVFEDQEWPDHPLWNAHHPTCEKTRHRCKAEPNVSAPWLRLNRSSTMLSTNKHPAFSWELARKALGCNGTTVAVAEAVGQHKQR